MRTFWRALRAATIETLGVVLVVILVFGLPTWSLQQAADTPTNTAAIWNWLRELPQQVQQRLALMRPNTQQQTYAEERLEYYSQLYRSAAANCVRGIVGQADAQTPRG